jgi:hypothetical protein
VHRLQSEEVVSSTRHLSTPIHTLPRAQPGPTPILHLILHSLDLLPSYTCFCTAWTTPILHLLLHSLDLLTSYACFCTAWTYSHLSSYTCFCSAWTYSHISSLRLLLHMTHDACLYVSAGTQPTACADCFTVQNICQFQLNHSEMKL